MLRDQREIVTLVNGLERIDVHNEIREICRRNHVLLDAVLGGKRTPLVVRARDECCAYLRSLGMSYPEVGKLVGLDHSSVIAACKRHEVRGVHGPAAT